MSNNPVYYSPLLWDESVAVEAGTGESQASKNPFYDLGWSEDDNEFLN